MRGNDSRLRYDAMSSSYDEDRVQSYFDAVKQLIAEWVGDTPKRVLEVGSGTGEYCIMLAARGHDVLGLDVSPQMVKLAGEKAAARELTTCRFEIGDAQERIPTSGTIDRLLLIDCWECFPDPGALLKNARNGLSLQGELLIVTPNNWLFPLFWVVETLRIKKNRPAFEHHNSYPHRIRQLAKRARLRVDFVRPFFYLTTLQAVLTKDEPKR
jgi:SAM-dependent methyltransferase